MCQHLAFWTRVATVFVLTAGFAYAQTATVTGRVTDAETGEPLPGANVVIADLQTVGASTGLDGAFVIPAIPVRQQPYTVRASYTGYTTMEESVQLNQAGQTATVNFALSAGVQLEGVVVTALGIERDQRSLGYATQQVAGDLIERSNESNLVNALAGKVAGVQVTSSSGQPGRGSRIVIRGNSSFTGSNQPLFIVDGVPISNDEDENPEGQGSSVVFTGGTSNRAVDIDPNTIASVNVLKGAAAMALYGSRAANGAVIITTKGGRAGGGAQPTRVTFNSTFRWDEPIIDGYQTQYTLGTRGCFQSGTPASAGGFNDVECWTAQTDSEGNPLSPPAATQTTLNWGPSIDELNQNQRVLSQLGVTQIPVVDPRREFYQTGGTTENSLSLQGNLLGGNYFASLNRLDQGGIVPNTYLDRTNLLAKFGADLSDQMQVETTISYTNTQNRWANEGNGALSPQWSLINAPISAPIERRGPDGQLLNQAHSTGVNNPFWLTENNGYTSDVDRFVGNLNVSYRILPWLRISERVGLDTYTDTRKGMVEVGTLSRPDGSLFDQSLKRREINSDLILQAERQQFGLIGVDVLVGNNINYRDYSWHLLQGQQLGVPGFFNIGNASSVTGDQYTQEQALIGLYSQATVDYDDWAYLTLTARNDWSSTLPEENNSYFYPSASLSIVFSEALGFFQDVDFLDLGKVRGSVARIGNDAPVYSTSTTFVQATPGDGTRGNIDIPFGGVNAYRLSNVLGNPELRPELSTEYEVGLELQFLQNRVRFDGSYYNRTTQDQIFSVPVSAATGFVQRLLNAGELRNQGVELYLGLTPIATRDFSWTIDANWSRNQAEVVELAEGVTSIFLAGFTNPQIRIQEGKDGYGVIWGRPWARANREDHADLFAQYPDLREGQLLIDEDGIPLQADALGNLGNVQPDWTANIRTGLSYRGVSLSGLIDIRRGGDILNFDLFYGTFYGVSGVTADRGSEFVYEGFNVDLGRQNDVTIVRDETFYRNIYSSHFENFIEDGSFVKLRELSLSYTVPGRYVQRAGLQGATISATGRNLWTASDFSYGDPEGSLVGTGNGQGFYHMVTPGTRSFSLGMRLTF
jgi:TonB-linked SusC/RagA family outer membrane protein